MGLFDAIFGKRCNPCEELARLEAAQLTEGPCKGGQNPPLDPEAPRPPAPHGSGGLQGRREPLPSLSQRSVAAVQNVAEAQLEILKAMLRDSDHAHVADELFSGASHGHVWPRHDGARARCGGPAACEVCQHERRLLLCIEEFEDWAKAAKAAQPVNIERDEAVQRDADRYAAAARTLARRLALKGDAAYAAGVLEQADIDTTALVRREATGRDDEGSAWEITPQQETTVTPRDGESLTDYCRRVIDAANVSGGMQLCRWRAVSFAVFPHDDLGWVADRVAAAARE